MLQDNFIQRKKETFLKKDKSSKGCWDERIRGLCEKINSFDEYYTTSSCSGRVVIMIDQDKKEEGLFLNVYHDLIRYKELKEDLVKIARASHSRLKESVNSKNFEDNNISAKNPSVSRIQSNSIKFKQEPCILHVACKNLKDAEKLLGKARAVGWKRSGIISLGKNIILELISTEKLEFPIINNGKILVDDEFLKVVIKKSNENLKKSWEKIEGLKKSL